MNTTKKAPLKRPSPDYDQATMNFYEWSAQHRRYVKATGRCSICTRKLVGDACPQGHM